MAVVLLIGHCLGSSFYGWRNSFNLTWFFFWEENTRRFGGSLFCAFLDNLKGKELKSV